MTTLFDSLVTDFVTKLRASTRRTPEQTVYYQTHPAEWLIDHLGIERTTLYWDELPAYQKCCCDRCVEKGNKGKPHLWDGDRNPLVKALNGLVTHKQVGVESAANTGKTIILVAGGSLWFADVWTKSQVITIAPKEDQLLLHGWKEIDEFWPKFQDIRPAARKGAKIIQLQWPLKKWRILAFTAGTKAEEQSRSATKAQGFHERHQLGVFEEMPGIAAAIINAFQATSSGDHNILLGVGNPDHQQDPLHKFCSEPSTLKVRISAYDHPNVVSKKSLIPAAVQSDAIARMKARWGEDSPLFQSRVRGFSPAESKEALIKLKWCYAARDAARPLHWEKGKRALGVDVAQNEGTGDEAAEAWFTGPVCTEVDSFLCNNANRFGDRLAVKMTSLGIDPEMVGVDIDGLGIGTWNQMRKVHPKVQGLHSGAGMVENLIHLFDVKEVFGNFRAQMWWLGAKDLEATTVWLPDDEDLFADLISVEWFSRGGKIWLKPKDEAKQKLGRSPNKGDAWVYGNWVRQVKKVHDGKKGAGFSAVRAK